MRDLAEQWIQEHRNIKKNKLNKALRGVELDKQQQGYINYIITNADGQTVVTLCSILEAVRNAK